MLFVLLLSTLVLYNVDSARILGIIPTASYSHQMFFHQLWRELALRGHDMVVVTTDPTNEILPNFKEINIKESYGPMKALLDVFMNESFFALLIANKGMEAMLHLSDFQLSLPQVQTLIHNQSEHFDLLMVEHFPSVSIAFKHRFNCPMIGVLSMSGFPDSHNVMGNPLHALMYPIPILPFQEDLNFGERIVAALMAILFDYMHHANIDDLDLIAKKHFGQDTPHIFSLYEETDMLFENTNPMFSAIRPFTPSTVNIAGGIHMKPQKPLPKDLKKFLDSANEGVVYFSLGSNVKSKDLSSEMKSLFVESFRQLPCKILWKFEDDSMENLPGNVKTVKWAPQQDVLRHKNVKVFVTQGGLQSLEESLYSHVPMVMIPFFGDQQANAAKAQRRGLGLALDRFTLTTELLKTSIQEVLENQIYRNNVRELAMRIQDEPMPPLEKAVWWTEYVLRHGGGQHLKGPKIPTYQYYYVDVIACLSVVLCVAIAVFYIVIKQVMRLLRLLLCSKPAEMKVKTT